MNVQYRKLAVGRSFGVELEVGNLNSRSLGLAVSQATKRRVRTTTKWTQTHDNDYWHVKKDATCGLMGHGLDYGWEVASFCASHSSHIAEICAVAQSLSEAGAETNHNCGFHIHASLPDYNCDQAGVMLARWAKMEKILCGMVPAHRVDNPYCRTISKSKVFGRSVPYSPNQAWMLLKPRDLSIHNNREKKVTLNFVNFASYQEKEVSDRLGRIYFYNQIPRNTVELRLPEGTLCKRDIANWIRFFLNFVNSCSSAKMPRTLRTIASIETFLRYCGLSSGDEYLFLSQPLFETKVWVLERLMLYGNSRQKAAAKSKLSLISAA